MNHRWVCHPSTAATTAPTSHAKTPSATISTTSPNNNTNDPNITKEDLFYYVYGILHSPTYRSRFADDLKKSLPRIPLVDSVDDYEAFEKAGRELGELHVKYEQVPPSSDVTVWYQGKSCTGRWDRLPAAHLRVTKMKLGPSKVGGETKDKRTIVYNDFITITNVPLRAYEYIVNGKSAVEWIIDRYQIKQDKDSEIVNDPNKWCDEHEQPDYILKLLLSVITVSVRALEIVDGLPELRW